MPPRKRLIVFTGAGMSAESGIKTFRDHDGLWENYPIEEVATPEAFQSNPHLVLDFYNMRRRDLLKATPNSGHLYLAKLEAFFDVHIITQNVDDLHERAGSTHVLHLHGELLKVRSTKEPSLIYPWKKDLTLDDRCDLGSPLRPHIVWFGEMVPAMDDAIQLTHTADIFMVIGTSLAVYPAAHLVFEVPAHVPKFLIDPKPPTLQVNHLTFIQEGASAGVQKLYEKLMHEYQDQTP